MKENHISTFYGLVGYVNINLHKHFPMVSNEEYTLGLFKFNGPTWETQVKTEVRSPGGGGGLSKVVIL